MVSLEEFTRYHVEFDSNELNVVIACLNEVIKTDEHSNDFLRTAQAVRAVLNG